MNAWGLCTSYRRPHIFIAEDVGESQTVEPLAVIICVNCHSSIYFLSQSVQNYLSHFFYTNDIISLFFRQKSLYSLSQHKVIILPNYTLSFPLFYLVLMYHLSFTYICTCNTGGWSKLMDLMSSLGIVCSVAIICFAETELGEYTTFERVVIFLLAEQVLLLFKFILHCNIFGCNLSFCCFYNFQHLLVYYFNLYCKILYLKNTLQLTAIVSNSFNY